MSVGRNDPCPCGSGRKYKNCCLRKDQETGAWTRMGLTSPDPGAAASEPVWQAEIVPVHAAIAEDPGARPAVLLVTAGPRPIHAEMLTRPSAEAEDIADELARGVRETMQEHHCSPAGIQVRYEAVADGLRGLLGPDDIEVAAARTLAGLDICADLIKSHFWGGEDYPDVQQPQTWVGWGLSEVWADALHGAAAAFYRARPWVYFPASMFVQALPPSGGQWSCLVLGEAAVEAGISLYSRREDLIAMVTAGELDATRDAFANLPGRVITMLFDEGRNIHPKMVREVMSHGWVVSSPQAYPVLQVAHSPAGGITARDAYDLVLIVEAVAAFSREKGREIYTMAEPEWIDMNGVVLRLENVVPVELRAFSKPVWTLAPGGATGAGADPEAGLRPPEDMEEFADQQIAIADEFMIWLDEKGLRESTVDRHSLNVALFLYFLTYNQVITVAAVHEYDLRLFLYLWCPVKGLDGDRRRERSLLTSLKKFFRFLAEEMEIICRWSGPILADRATFVKRWESCPYNFNTDQTVEAWEVEGYADLGMRLLYPDNNLGTMEEWGEMGMGVEEDELYSELHRRWLIWRDELIVSGIEHPGELRSELVERQRTWEETPHPRYRHRPPIDVVEDERIEIEEKLRIIESFNSHTELP